MSFATRGSHNHLSRIALAVLVTTLFGVLPARAQWNSGSNLQWTLNQVAIGRSTAAAAQLTVSANTDGVDLFRFITTGSREQALLTFAHGNSATWSIGAGLATGGHEFGLYDVNTGTVRWMVNSAGNFGIGTTVPSAKLEVNGTARVTGNMTVDGNLAAKYQDVAEWVPGSDDLPPGTVVVIDSRHNNHVTKSERPYDAHVAGVISPQPGLVLGTPGEGKHRVATFGRVRVKVDATRSPIAVGDLLVTSSRAGVAMKSEPLHVAGEELHRPGTLLGKALEPLASGEGEILVLLSLQ
jgi:hypothetical protein